MNEQLVDFKTAKLAKKKGFNWKCNFYDKCIIIYEAQNIEYNRKKFGSYENWNHRKYGTSFTSLPTQSQLQKWLREEKNISLLLEMVTNEVGYSWTSYRVNPEEEPNFYFRSDFVWYSYEEALENGLYSILKKLK